MARLELDTGHKSERTLRRAGLRSLRCHSTKSLLDSGGMWLVRSVFPTVEIVGNRRCLEDGGILDLQANMLRDAQLDR